MSDYDDLKVKLDRAYQAAGEKAVALLEAEARIQAVRELHCREQGPTGRSSCRECREPQDGYNVEWPCPTIRTLDGDA